MIKVLRKGVHGNNFHRGYAEFWPICSSAILIKANGNNILVDPGHIAWKGELVKLLKAEKLKPDDIDYALVTHHHLDHSSNMGSFPNAKIFMGNGYVSHSKASYMVYEDIKLLEDKLGIRILKTPGHTAESRSYLYETAKVRYICAGDAVNEDVIRGLSKNGISDRKQFLKSLELIFGSADVIIPGHGRVIKGELKKELYKLIKKL